MDGGELGVDARAQVEHHHGVVPLALLGVATIRLDDDDLVRAGGEEFLQRRVASVVAVHEDLRLDVSSVEAGVDARGAEEVPDRASGQGRQREEPRHVEGPKGERAGRSPESAGRTVGELRTGSDAPIRLLGLGNNTTGGETDGGGIGTHARLRGLVEGRLTGEGAKLTE